MNIFEAIQLLSKDLFIFILWALVFCLPICLYEDARSPGTGVADSCELTSGCCELNLGDGKHKMEKK